MVCSRKILCWLSYHCNSVGWEESNIQARQCISIWYYPPLVLISKARFSCREEKVWSNSHQAWYCAISKVINHDNVQVVLKSVYIDMQRNSQHVIGQGNTLKRISSNSLPHDSLTWKTILMFVVWVGEVGFFLLASVLYKLVCIFINCVGTAGDDLLDLLDQAVAWYHFYIPNSQQPIHVMAFYILHITV